jgi:transcriptional regulator with XRE-family HTH domain
LSGREFRAIRLQLGLTQEALAKKLEKDRETVNAWECSRRRIPTVVDYAMRYLRIAASSKGKEA